MTASEEPPDTAPSSQPGDELITFQLGTSQFALSVLSVREVVRVPRITRVPFPPPAVAGVVSIRGAILPVVDLGELLLGAPASREGRLLIVRHAETRSDVGLLVDRVIDLVPGGAERVEPPPEVIASLPEGSVEAVLSPDPGRSVTLLNLENVLGRVSRRGEERR